MEREAIIEKPKESNEEIDYHEIIECIACALDAKDPYTAGHSLRVSDMAECIAKMMNFKEKDVEKIHIAAHLHDIGKIGVPDAVLNKTEKLDDEEWQAMKRHPSIGAEILSKSEHLSEVKEIVLCHHERFDGKGYPSSCDRQFPDRRSGPRYRCAGLVAAGTSGTDPAGSCRQRQCQCHAPSG